ncbi:MAG TPA: AbrB/MazE/SpoVT family DNA-binding domain-containing protein [Beijerinckiaceae bacterium]
MKVARWGNSLAVRLPKSYVDALELRVGDELNIPCEAIQKVSTDQERRAEALQRLTELSQPLPVGFTFRRDELYEDHRGGFAREADAADEP